MQSGTFRISANRWISIPAMTVLFGLSFLLPVVGIYYYSLGGGKLSSPSADSAPSDTEESVRDYLFPEALAVRASNTFIRIPHSERIQPAPEQDFLFSLWIKPSKLPKGDERVVIASKVDGLQVTKRGFSIALTREGDQILPLIWWQSTGGQAGGMHTFSALEYMPDSWIFLALSFRDSKFLGLHSSVVSEAGLLSDLEEPQIQLLGGYEVSAEDVPSARSDLIVGSRGSGMFKGRIGPLFISQQKFSEEELEVLLLGLVKKPQDLPEVVEESDVNLWTPGVVRDLSARTNALEVIVRGKLKTDLVQNEGVSAIRKKAGKKKHNHGSESGEPKKKEKRKGHKLENP